MYSSTRFLLLCFSLLISCLVSKAYDVSYDGKALTINGQRKIIISGSIHYPRSTIEMWPQLITKAREGGLNAIETYVFWNAHEPQRRQYDFSGNKDLVRFVQEVGRQGLHLILRIGPYVCAEWNYGGVPVWLHNMPGVEFRTENKVFQDEMADFTTKIVKMMKDFKLFANQGGPIILAQIENEYGNVMSHYGDAGKKYVQWCADLAQSLNIGSPWIMCQQDDAPAPIIPTCNGYYCDSWNPKRGNVPKMWTENWSGWYKSWGWKDPHRTAEDLAFAVARFFQYGGTLQNYYMYHGGTNFGRTGGGPYITTSYDYDAPLDEYGNYNQPKWGHLKNLHQVLMSVEDLLTYGAPRNIQYPNMVDVQIYSLPGRQVCFIGNAHETDDADIEFQNTRYHVPAWSVTILPDCRTQAYNTARVNSQTSIMVKQANDADGGQEPYSLVWQWKNEHIEHFEGSGLVKGSLMTMNGLVDQKTVTNDTSDYLWYLTRIEHDKSELVTLRVNTGGHVLHVFVNHVFIGTQYAQNGHFSFTFEKQVQLNRGDNQITLCSSTAGLTNYGADFDTIKVGVSGVSLVTQSETEGTVTRDLSAKPWVYKVGLSGETMQLFDLNRSELYDWRTEALPEEKQFTWYKTTFPTPSGDDPVVVDLNGMGKGHAWVNGKSIGRFWPGYYTDQDDCTMDCDYRGPYNPNKCTSNCGNPTQRWYHIPRAFLAEDGQVQNKLVLFEEIGGHPYRTQVQTITVGTVCADAFQGSVLELSCQGANVISDIKFVSFGMPHGDCGSFRVGPCQSSSAFSYVQQQCLNKPSCSINVNEVTLGPTDCVMTAFELSERFTGNRLAVQLECAKQGLFV